MYVIIWEYQIQAERATEFEETYGETGAWVGLFKNGSGYLGTELLHDSAHLDRYITIDRWASRGEYESFLSNWKTHYETLDAHCEDLMEGETLLGKWESISLETR